MTRLLVPSAGEVLDRITILDLKISHAKPLSIDTSHFDIEKQALEDYLDLSRKAFPDLESRIQLAREQLAAINGRLWDLEDELRELPSPEFAHEAEILRLAQLAKLIAHFNDQRMKSIRILNEAFGERGQEKIYRVDNR